MVQPETDAYDYSYFIKNSKLL